MDRGLLAGELRKVTILRILFLFLKKNIREKERERVGIRTVLSVSTLCLQGQINGTLVVIS